MVPVSAPVDVLAVMDCAAETLDRGADGSAGLCEARAAVSELINAAEFARYAANGPIGYTPGADRRLAAAIARVQGGAAC
jgi:hypothetical protein